MIVWHYLKYWKDKGKKAGDWEEFGDATSFFNQSACTFITYAALFLLAVLMSSIYATCDLNRYHNRRLIRILHDERIVKNK